MFGWSVASSFRPSYRVMVEARSCNGPVISELPESSEQNGEQEIVAAALEPRQLVEVNIESIIGNHKLCAKH